MSCRHGFTWNCERLHLQTAIHYLSHTFLEKAFARFEFKLNIPASERLSDHYLDSETKYSLQISEAVIDCKQDMDHRLNFSQFIEYY